jgi:hypothetical protein
MIAKGNNIKVKPKALEHVLKSGIIIPDHLTPSSQQWGEVLDGGLKECKEVLFVNAKCPEIDGEKIVNKNKILFWR